MTVSDRYVCSLQSISPDVMFAMTMMGANPDRFSGVSARNGGLSTAIEAGIHEAGLFLLTGDGQAKAARDYMHIWDTRRPAARRRAGRAFRVGESAVLETAPVP